MVALSVGVGILLGPIIISPAAYWLIRRGYKVSKVVKAATYTSAVLMLPALIGTALIILGLFGTAGPVGIALLVGIFGLQYLLFPYIILSTAKVRKPTAEESELLELLDEVKKTSGYSKEVELYIADVDIPNAFAVGNVFKKAIVIQKGLLRVLDKDEVKAVIAHELGHIAHNDNTYIFAASFTPYLTYVIGLGVLTAGIFMITTTPYTTDDRGESKGASFLWFLGGISMTLFGLGLMLIAFLANVGVLGFSRIREHLADMYSVKTTMGTKVVDALKKIEGKINLMIQKEGIWGRAKPSLKRMLYIIPAIYSDTFGFISYLRWSNPFSTHPLTEAREYIAEKYLNELLSEK